VKIRKIQNSTATPIIRPEIISFGKNIKLDILDLL